MIARLAGPPLALLAVAALYWGWLEIGQLRGTVLWEFRYLVLGVAAFFLLGILELGHGLLRARNE